MAGQAPANPQNANPADFTFQSVVAAIGVDEDELETPASNPMANSLKFIPWKRPTAQGAWRLARSCALGVLLAACTLDPNANHANFFRGTNVLECDVKHSSLSNVAVELARLGLFARQHETYDDWAERHGQVDWGTGLVWPRGTKPQTCAP